MPAQISLNLLARNSIYEICYPLFGSKTLIRFPSLTTGELEPRFSLLYKLFSTINALTLFRMREKAPAIIFSGLISTNVGISLQTFLTFKLFCHTIVKFQGHAY